MVRVDHQKTTITSQMKTKSLRPGTLSFGEERLGFSHIKVGTHSIRSGFPRNYIWPKCTQKQLLSWYNGQAVPSCGIYPHPGQWLQQGYKYPHGKQASFLQNTRKISFLPRTRTLRHRTKKAGPKQVSTIAYNFLPLATAIKCSPRKEIPCHCSYPLSSKTAI